MAGRSQLGVEGGEIGRAVERVKVIARELKVRLKGAARAFG